MGILSKATSRFCLAVGLVAMTMQGALGHTYFSSLYLGNDALAEGDCMRPKPELAYDSPIPLVTSNEMTCGWSTQKANRKCPVAAGSKVGLQWHHQSTAPTDDIVDPTHVGPIMVYLAKSESGSGNVWFKIYEDGYNPSTKKWAVNTLLDNKGRVDITIPSDIAPGNYLMRGELIALHGANALNGVQPYVGCAEITISGSGKVNPAGVAIPGVYSNTDAGMLFDRYGDFTSYPIPGPAVYKSSSSPISSLPSSSGASNSAPANTGSSSSTPAAAATSRPVNTPAPSNPNTGSSNTPAPSNPNTGSSSNIKFGTKDGSNMYWVGAVVNGGGETIVKVEMTDSGNVKNWAAMTDMSYAYVYAPPSPAVLPISLRITSSSGKQVVLTNVYTSFSAGALVDTGKAFSSSSSSPSTPAPTNKPVNTPAATNKPSTPVTTAPVATSKPSTPSTGSGKLNIESGSSQWWIALTLSSDVSQVEIKDSGAYSTFRPMFANSWGGPTVYSFATSGTAMTAPLTARITSKSGAVITANIASFAVGSVVQLPASL